MVLYAGWVTIINACSELCAIGHQKSGMAFDFAKGMQLKTTLYMCMNNLLDATLHQCATRHDDRYFCLF